MGAEELVAWYRQHNRAPMRLPRGKSEASASPERLLEHKLSRVLDNLFSAVRAGQSTPSLEYVRNEAPQLLKRTGMVEKAGRYVALWQQRGTLPTGPPLDSSDEEGKKAYNFLKLRRRELPGGDPQVHAILSAAFPKWAITRKRKEFVETDQRKGRSASAMDVAATEEPAPLVDTVINGRFKAMRVQESNPQVSGARTRVFTNFVDATMEVLTSEAPSTASEVAMLKSDELPWGTPGFAVALSPTALVPVYVTLIERGPRAPLIDMRKSGISPESREAIRTGVLAALVNYKQLFTALARVHKYRLTMHEGLWHLLAGYRFHVDIRGVDVEGNSLGFTVALATVSLLLGVPLLPHTGTTGAMAMSGSVLRVADVADKVTKGMELGLKTFYVPSDAMDSLAELLNQSERLACNGAPELMSHVQQIFDMNAAPVLGPFGSNALPCELSRADEGLPKRESMWLGKATGLVLVLPNGKEEVEAWTQVVEVAVCAASRSGAPQVVLVGGEEAGAEGAIQKVMEWFRLHSHRVVGLREDPVNCEIHFSLPGRPCKLGSDSKGLVAALTAALLRAFTGISPEDTKDDKVVWGSLNVAGNVVMPRGEMEMWTGPLRALSSSKVKTLLVPSELVERLRLTPAAHAPDPAAPPDQPPPPQQAQKGKKGDVNLMGFKSIAELWSRYTGADPSVTTIAKPAAHRFTFSGARLCRLPQQGDTTGNEEALSVSVDLWEDDPSSPLRLNITSAAKTFEVRVVSTSIEIELIGDEVPGQDRVYVVNVTINGQGGVGQEAEALPVKYRLARGDINYHHWIHFIGTIRFAIMPIDALPRSVSPPFWTVDNEVQLWAERQICESREMYEQSAEAAKATAAPAARIVEKETGTTQRFGWFKWFSAPLGWGRS